MIGAYQRSKLPARHLQANYDQGLTTPLQQEAGWHRRSNKADRGKADAYTRLLRSAVSVVLLINAMFSSRTGTRKRCSLCGRIETRSRRRSGRRFQMQRKNGCITGNCGAAGAVGWPAESLRLSPALRSSTWSSAPTRIRTDSEKSTANGSRSVAAPGGADRQSRKGPSSTRCQLERLGIGSWPSGRFNTKAWRKSFAAI